MSKLLKVFLWKRYKIRVTIESIKFAPLGGRIFAKNLTITTTTETISILHLNLTWRYWLYKVNRLSDYYYTTEKLANGKGNRIPRSQNEKLPCRLLLILDGFEIFMYNRTAAYDAILKNLQQEDKANGTSHNVHYEKSYPYKESDSKLHHRGGGGGSPSTTDYDETSSSTSKSDTTIVPATTSTTEGILGILLRIFPMKVRIKKGAFVLGNSTTPSLLLASFDSASGVMDISKPTHTIDIFKLMYDLSFDKFQLWFKSNITYDKYRYSDGEHPESYTSELNHLKKYKQWYRFQRALNTFYKLINRVRHVKPVKNIEADFLRDQWRGLKRYVGEHPDAKALINTEEEYAKYSLILDSVVTRIIYYYDIPGIVPSTITPLSNDDNPEFGVEVELSLATIHYGPWADRQRVPLQNMFFPSLSRDSEITKNPIAGTIRQYSGFQATVIVKDEVILRIPTREPSKLKEIYRSPTATRNKVTPPFGWLECKLGEGSNISSFTSYIATSTGWPNTLRVMFNGPEVRTSVNHDILFIADTHEINADVGFPLEWNGKCDWKFNQISHNARIFFLREHTMLLSDLFEDFAAGEPVQYEYFRPFIYGINWKMHDYKVFLNVNDSNIINNPLDFNNNKYLSFQGELINIQIDIPLNGKFSKSTTVPFNITTSSFDLILDTPVWHTTNAFMNETKIMGNSKDFTIEGSYTFFSMVEINTSDVIEIKCIGDYVSLKFYGFLIRYLFSIRENYFGDTIHFKTFEEYTQTLEDDGEERGLNVPDVEDIDYWNIVKTDNDVDVFFFFQVRHGLIILPGNIYNSTNHIGLTFDSLDIDIRFCNYYMDLQADLSPIEGVLIDSSTNCLDNLCNTAAYKQAHFHGKPDINIDGLTIHAHRIFGLPPEEITYLCIWEFAVDSLLIEGFPTVDALGTSISTIIFGFKDVENALHSELPTTYDGMTIAFRCESTIINLVPDLNDPSTTMNVDLGFIQFNLCDIFNRRYSKKITAFIPAIEIQLIEKLSTNTNRIIGHMKSSLVFNNICQDAGMPQRRQDLIDHMKRNDAPFHRCPFMLYPEDRNQAFNDAYGCFLTSLTLPKIPPPLTADTYMEDSDVSDSIDLESDISDISDNDNENDIYYSRSSGKFSPTINYNDEDFTPASKYDPSNEYDNFILEFDEVQSFLTPRGLLSLSKLVEMKQPNIDTLLDKFQEEIVGKLKKYLTSKSLITNTRVVCPEITIRLGEFEVSEAREVFAKSQLVPTINVQIIEPSIALSKSVVKKSGEMSVDTQGGSVVALHVKEVIGNVSNPQGFVMPVYISMKDIELWISEEKEIVGSVNVEEIEADIKADQMEWLIKYALHLQDVLAPTIDQLHKHHKGEKEATAEMIYRLSMAAVDHHIDHDPGVLTKPAYILRAKRDHVRYFDIWKVMTRIRHIKNNLPQNWFTTNPLGDLNWQLPPSAYEDVLDIFSRWRSWEANQTQRSFMFKNIFSEEVPVEKDMEMQIEVGNISIKLANKSDGSDSIVIEKLGGNVKKQASNQVGVVVNVGSYNSRLSTISMDTIHSVVRSMSANTSKDESLSSEDGSSSSKEPLSLFLTLTITDFYQQVSLPFSSLELVAKDISNSVNVLETSTLISTDLAMVEVGVWGKDHKFLTTKVHDIGLIFADTTFKRIDLMIGSITSKSQDQRGLLPLAIEKIMSQDVAYIENMIPKQTTTTSTTTTTDFSLADLCSVVVSVEITEVNWLMEVIPHLAIRGLVRESKLELSTIDNDLSINWYTQKADIAASLDRSQLFEVQNSHIWINCDVDMARDLYLVKSSANVGNTKFLVPEITRTSERIHARKDHILNSIKKFEAIMKKDESVKVATTTGTTTTTTTNLLDRIAFKFRFTNDYIGVVTLVSDARYSYEMETVSFGIQNVASTLAIDQTIIHTLVPTYGELVVAAARIFIIHKSIPMTISNLLDVNVAIKVFNDNDKDKPKAGSRSLQVESQYCRVCLGPSSLFKIINFVDAIMVIMNKFDSDSNSDSDSETSTPPMDYSEITKILSSVQLLSYNFCLGWLFPTPSKEYPGIILGAERFFVVAEERLGKFTLIDAYLSVANGSSASNFFSLSSEKNNLNRALLPNMQFVYSVENSVDIRRNMRILITGDELDVKFLSTSMVIVEHLGTSINHVQRFLRSRQLSIIKKDHPPPPAQPQTQTQDYVSSFQSAFDSVEFLATFAGSNVLLYRLDTDESGEAPSLFLHSPAVKIAFQYKHHKFEKVKHIIKGEILTFPSDNTVYSSCVPVIIDIVEGVTRMMQNSKHHSDTPSNNNVNVNVSGAGGAMNFDSVFGDMDIHFGLKIDKQQLSLSCEPTAKVATVVGIESIYIQLNSTEPGLALTILFDSISASLQHIYSREISGSISIEKVILSSCLDIYDGLQFRSSGCLVDVDGYINVKQYQDVELFKDIWFPKKHLDVYSNNNGQPHISQSMSLTNRFKEVSNSYAVPWVVTFFVTNISLRVDFGQSLCDTSLNVDMLWAVSKKSTNWSQDLKLGVNTINLECKGRLGGNLKIKDINIHTAINWMSDDIILDIPLILVSIGIEKLHLKLSFDYHVFAIANIEDFSMSIFNQKSELSNLKDRLFVLFRFEAAEIYITSLTASNCLDIYNTISRMVQDNQRSYKEILRDGKGMKQKSSSDYDKEMLETIKKLETQIEVFAGHVLIHVYPTSFNDSKVLVVKLDESKANFQQNEYTSGVSNELDIQFNDLTVSLSVTQPVSDEFITDCTVNDFVDYAHKAKGGQIFLFPSFKISMRTFQKDNENIIEFLYQSTFDGTVDIRWNLGSVNFIREMFSIHQNAVASRTVYRKVGEQVGFKEDIFKSQDGQASTIMRQQLNEEDPTSEIDQAINNTISKVSEESQFQYLPLAPPIIEAPQLKELGNATPPLEWFGLHRNKFPNVTHQIGIVALQKIIREVEIRYSKILGRA